MLDNTKTEPGKFALDIIWVSMSQVVIYLLGAITLPVLTKTYNSEIYGIWSQINVTVSLLVPVLTLHFGTAVVRFLAGEDDKVKRCRSLGTMLCVILIFACLILVVTNLMASQISLLFFDSPAYPTFIRLTFLWSVVEALFTFLLSYLRARGKIKRLSIVQAVFAAARIVLIVILALSGLRLEWIVISLICVESVFTLGLLSMIILEDGFPVLNFEGINKFLAFSIPQVPSGFFMWIISASDRYFITHFLGLSQTGIYSSSNLLGNIIYLFYFPVGFVLLPVVSEAWERNQQGNVRSYFEYSTKLFLTSAIPAAAGLTILSQSVLKIFTTSEYLAGWELVFLIAVGSIFLGMYQLNVYILYLVKQTKWIPLIIVVASAISLGLNLALIPIIGIIGAAVSNIASYFVLAVIVSIWARKIIRYGIDYKYVSKVIMATLLMSLSVYFLRGESILNLALAIIAGVVVYCVALLCLRSFSKEEMRLIKQMLSRIVPWVR